MHSILTRSVKVCHLSSMHKLIRHFSKLPDGVRPLEEVYTFSDVELNRQIDALETFLRSPRGASL